MKKVRMYALMAGAGAVAIATVQNWAPVSMEFLFWVVRAPLAIVLSATFMIGAVSGWLVRRRVPIRFG